MDGYFGIADIIVLGNFFPDNIIFECTFHMMCNIQICTKYLHNKIVHVQMNIFCLFISNKIYIIYKVVYNFHYKSGIQDLAIWICEYVILVVKICNPVQGYLICQEWILRGDNSKTSKHVLQGSIYRIWKFVSTNSKKVNLLFILKG